jgi:hypothetical protein
LYNVADCFPNVLIIEKLMKLNSKFLRRFGAPVLIFAGSAPLHADTYIWDTNPTTTGAQDGDGIWTTTSTNFWRTTTPAVNAAPPLAPTVAPFVNHTIQFGSGATGSNTVSFSNGGATANYANSSVSTGLLINHNFTFNPVISGDGLGVGSVTVANGATVNMNLPLTGGNFIPGVALGRRTWAVNNGSTLNLTAGGTLQAIINTGAAASTVNINGGTFLAGGGGTNGALDGNVILGGGGSTTVPAILTINHAAGATISSAVQGNFNIGGNAANNNSTTTVYNLNGGVINNELISLGGSARPATPTVPATPGSLSMATFNLNSGSTTNTETRIANDGGSGTMNVLGGTMTTGNIALSRQGNTSGPITGTLNISGGVVKAAKLELGSVINTTTTPNYVFAAGSTSTFNLSGGTFYLNTGGIVTNTGNDNLVTAVNLSGGTIGALGNWTSTVNMNLPGTGPTVKVGNDAGTPFTITLNGNLSGPGAIRLGADGLGTLTIGGTASTYSGGTFVTSGILQSPVASPSAGYSSFGAGDVSVVGFATQLNLQNNNSIADTATLYLDYDSQNLGLSFTGVEVVRSIVIKKGTQYTTLPPGDYDAAKLVNPATYDLIVTGNGVLRIPVAGYTSWATTNAGGQAANLDYDGDGVPNGVEYFFGATGSSFTPNPSVVNGKITWPMSSSATGVTYKVQTSTTLAAGSWTDVPQGSLVVTAGSPIGSVAYTLPTGLPKAFYRLVVTTP